MKKHRQNNAHFITKWAHGFTRNLLLIFEHRESLLHSLDGCRISVEFAAEDGLEHELSLLDKIRAIAAEAIQDRFFGVLAAVFVASDAKLIIVYD